MFRKTISLILCLTLLLSMSVSAFAIQGASDPKVKAIFIKDENGNLVEITKEEHDRILENLQAEKKQIINSVNNKDVKPLGMTDDWYRYDEEETGSKERSDLRSVDSNVQYNNTSSKSKFAFSYEKKVGAEFTINLSSNEKSAVRGGMSLGWNSSETYKEEHSFEVSPKKYGWVEIAPVMNYTEGYVRTFDWLGKQKDEKWVRTYIPRDGEMPEYFYYLMEDSEKPDGY
ncbi:hypothetical protein [Maledivibacter halophilus]|uniref:Uncharacterized protein n=1 Tax=Maledivibacter halophilus TaxID=36842 RepID=A0A1T5MIB2_9FIRM|nr:hypothetical protein [Maledivibacter halophilus]SKC87803.1 hypothetical protein SAMN02194393_04748 [Maledivibacter halophilus]